MLGIKPSSIRSGTLPVAIRFCLMTSPESKSETPDDLVTILIVEDEAVIRMLSADILSEAGFRVLEAQNADEAVTIMQGADRVALMFTDIRMPGPMDGLELATLVHTNWPAVRLLVTSGHCVLPDSDIPDGGQFVRKPYNLSELVSQIREIISTDPSLPQA